MESEKSKILFLHGYAQNGHIFNTRTKNLQKQLNKKFNNKFEYLFPDAPLILDKEEQTVENEIIRGWLKYIKDKDTKFYELKSVKYTGINEAINTIYKIGDEAKKFLSDKINKSGGRQNILNLIEGYRDSISLIESLRDKNDWARKIQILNN